MDNELLKILMRLVQAYKKQAEAQALVNVRWQTRLSAIEGELLNLIGADVDAELAKGEPEAKVDDEW